MAKKEKKEKRKWRFTEKMILIILLYCISVFERSLLYAFYNKSDLVWSYLLPIIGTLITSAFAVFVWKEKNENVPKIMANPNYDQERFIDQMREDLFEEYRNLEKTDL